MTEESGLTLGCRALSQSNRIATPEIAMQMRQIRPDVSSERRPTWLSTPAVPIPIKPSDVRRYAPSETGWSFRLFGFFPDDQTYRSAAGVMWYSQRPRPILTAGMNAHSR